MAERDDVEVTGCHRCPELVSCRSQIVNGTGPLSAELLFVGEAPGQQEDIEGEPFVGRSGEILDDVLQDHGLSRDTVRITNCVRCRPPDNRTPHVDELANCRAYLDTEIEIVDPALLIALGKVPAEQLLDRSLSVTAEAGRVEHTKIAGVLREVLICVHPAATLYDPSQRETLENAIETAVAHVSESTQRSLTEFSESS